MINLLKGLLSIFLMAVTFHMMITTKYTDALGDYILEYIGLKSWTGNNSGLHLTVIYFGILLIISLFFVKKYAINGLKLKISKVIIIFIVLMIIFSSITGMTARHIKSNSSGLLAIGFNSSDSSMNYEIKDNNIVEFEAEFELTNYSKEKKKFYLSIFRNFYKDKEFKEISFYTFDGKPAVFELESNETKSFLLTLDNYNVIIDREFKKGTLGGSGIIKEIVLTNDKGNKVKLDNNSFFGIEFLLSNIYSKYDNKRFLHF